MKELDTLPLKETRRVNKRHTSIWSLFSTFYIVCDHPILYMVNNSMSDERSDDEPKRKKHSSSSDIEELREVAEVLPDLFGALNESIPKLISNLIESIYSPESAGNVAKGIGQFYRNLIEEGIPEDVALDMTKRFVSSLDFGKLMDIVGDESQGTIRAGKKKHRKEYADDEEDFDEEYD